MKLFCGYWQNDTKVYTGRQKLHNCQHNIKEEKSWGAWVAQSVKCPSSAQVTISRFVGASPTSDSVLTARSLEPASDSVSPSHSAPPPLTLCLSLSKINKH